MKITLQRIIGSVAITFISATPAFAIEGLQISVQPPDVILSWPSTPGENYIVQYRPTLDPSTPWLTLTSTLPADWSASTTIFVDSNRVQSLSGQNLAMRSTLTGGAPAQSFSPALVEAVLAGQTSYPLTAPPMPPVRNSAGVLVPWEQVYGPVAPIMMPIPDALRQRVLTSLSQAAQSPSEFSFPTDGPQPNDPSPDDSGTAPDPGFYQVVKDGVKIIGLTNLTGGVILSNIVNIRFEAGDADWTTGTNVTGTLSSAVLLVDDVKFPGEGVLDGPPWQFAMDTAYLENGDHTLQVQVFWYDPNSTPDGSEDFFPSRYSDPVAITVSNSIYYPEWEEDIGEAATNAAYFLKTTCTNADWTIEIYDVNSNFVQRLTGHTDDGTIEAYWNLIDTNGIARTNADVDAQFGAVVTVADPLTTTLPPKKNTKGTWPDHGVWTIAYLDYFKHYYSADNDMQGHINEFALTAGDYGGYWLYYPPPGATNDIGQTYPLRFYNTNHLEDGVTASMIGKDSAMLKAFLSNTASRNFFYRGHGGCSSVGYLSASDLSAVIKHRYRFVLLQCCYGADGKLDHAFGIKGPGQFDIPYYQKTGVRPAAFMGNHGKSYFCNEGRVTINGVIYDGTIPWQVPYLYYEFLFYWDSYTMGWDLFSSIGQAMLDLPPIDGWSTDKQPGHMFKLYGYPFLHIDEYNYRTDWH